MYESTNVTVLYLMVSINRIYEWPLGTSLIANTNNGTIPKISNAARQYQWVTNSHHGSLVMLLRTLGSGLAITNEIIHIIIHIRKSYYESKYNNQHGHFKVIAQMALVVYAVATIFSTAMSAGCSNPTWDKLCVIHLLLL